jgi:hypothetical protein
MSTLYKLAASMLTAILTILLLAVFAPEISPQAFIYIPMCALGVVYCTITAIKAN